MLPHYRTLVFPEGSSMIGTMWEGQVNQNHRVQVGCNRKKGASWFASTCELEYFPIWDQTGKYKFCENTNFVLLRKLE